MELKNLDDVLSYRHDNLIKRYTQEYPHSSRPPEIVFKGLLQYLWLKNKITIDKKKDFDNKIPQEAYIYYPHLKEIDNMWHSFILFTKDYREFCLNFFGAFLEHSPSDEEAKHVDEEEAKKWLQYIGENLDEEYIKEWFLK